MKKTNVIWLDPETGEPVCSLDGCRKKFKEKLVEKTTLTVVNDKPIMYDVFYSKCVECGRKHAMTTDKQKTQESKSYMQKSLMFLREIEC
jgi:hypothetical protein